MELNTHLSHPAFDPTDTGCMSTAARVVNAIDWVRDAPAGLVAVEDIPQSALLPGPRSGANPESFVAACAYGPMTLTQGQGISIPT